MTTFQGIVFGIVQGLTEFLPVSSSGHLVLTNYYLGWGESFPLWAEIATNTGTLLAVLIVLRKDVWTALSGFAGLTSSEARKGEGWWLALLVLLGSIPTAIIGLGLREVFEHLSSPLPVSIALIVTGLILWFTPASGPKDEPKKLKKRDAFIGGLAQGLAVIPGISRSGTTIVTMMWRGASADLAARFSFLMYLLVSTGVMLIGISEVRGAGVSLSALLAMFVASFVTGYVALLWLFRLLKRGQFKWFAPYLWVVATITIIRVVSS